MAAQRKSTIKKPRSNGTPILASAKPTPSKSPKPPAAPFTQPAELSASDRAKLLDYLERTDRPFGVHTVPLSRKRKRTGANQLYVQDDLFQDRLTVQYEVKPRDKWESLRQYKKFTGKRRCDKEFGMDTTDLADSRYSWLGEYYKGRMHSGQA
jgi:hypothetical protein